MSIPFNSYWLMAKWSALLTGRGMIESIKARCHCKITRKEGYRTALKIKNELT